MNSVQIMVDEGTALIKPKGNKTAGTSTLDFFSK
jgi:hypothetical protein